MFLKHGMTRLSVHFELPLASTGVPPDHIPSDYYYRMTVRPIYKSYPIYAPGKEPPGYFEKLRELEPEIVFDHAKLKTEEDWIKAGELVFDAPITYDVQTIGFVTPSEVRNPAWYQDVRALVTREGVMPYARYVITRKGAVQVGNLSCAMCHTRIMEDGSTVKGAQGDFPFDRAIAFRLRTDAQPEHQRLQESSGLHAYCSACPGCALTRWRLSSRCLSPKSSRPLKQFPRACSRDMAQALFIPSRCLI